MALSERVRGLVASRLSETGGGPDFSIEYDPRGKPLLLSDPPLHMSLSHTGTTALLGLSSHPLGVDAESLRPIDQGAVSRRFFCPQEAEYVERQGPEGFFSLWVLKESLLKRSGEGLSGGLSSTCLVRDGNLIDSVDGLRLCVLREGALFLGFAWSGGEQPVIIRE